MISGYPEHRDTLREGMQPTYDVWGTVLPASENTDKGSVRVKVKAMRENMDTFDNVPVMTCYGGGDYGFFSLPEEGDVVRLTFVAGDFRHPVVTGCRFPESSRFVKDSCKEKNPDKAWKLKSGSRIALTGGKGEEKIQIAGPEHMECALDEKNQQILLTDKEKKNQLLLDKKEGRVQITSEKAIRLKCGDSSLELKKDGTVTVQCRQLTLEAKNVKIQGKTRVQVEGQELALSGTTNVSLSGKSSLKLSGAMISLN